MKTKLFCTLLLCIYVMQSFAVNWAGFDDKWNYNLPGLTAGDKITAIAYQTGKLPSYAAQFQEAVIEIPTIVMTTTATGTFGFKITSSSSIKVDWGNGSPVAVTPGSLGAVSGTLSGNTIKIYSDGISYLDVQDCKLTSLDVSGCSSITDLRCTGNQLSTLNVSANTALTLLYCYNNNLTALDVSKNILLKSLSCDHNQLSALDISKNTALKKLYCQKNQLSNLDVSTNTMLEVLYCDTNNLTTLNLTDNTALTELVCGNNQLTSLDVSHNTKLYYLSCEYNRLNSLTGIENINVEYLSLICYHNALKFSTLPLTQDWLGSFYAPQDTIQGGTVIVASAVDLSSEKTINGVLTIYNWYDITTEGIESEITTGVTDDGTGKFTFDSSLGGKKVRCKMTNSNFWKSTDATKLTLIYDVSLSGSSPTYYNVWCNGERFADDHLTIACGEGTAVYDPATKTLTLTHATIDTGCEIPEGIATTYCTSGIFTLEDLNVVLTGDNTINDTGGTGIDSYGSPTDVNISISGNGSLTITETAPFDGYGVYASGELSIKGVELFINSSCTGLWTGSDLTITNSKIIITNSQDNYFGIVVNNGNALIDSSILIGNKQPVSLYGSTSESGFFLFAEGSDYTLSNNSIIITYDPTAGPFVTGSDDGIISNPAGVAVWEVSNGKGGISYENGAISGFAATPGITVNEGSATTYGLSIGTFTGGSVTADKAAYGENEPVALTISAETGYVLDNILAYKTGDQGTVVALSGTGNTRTFAMPAYGVTVVATFSSSDQEAVNDAQKLVEGGTYTVAQTTANDASGVRTWLVGTLNALFGQSHDILFRSGIPVVGDVTVTDLIPAVAGTENNPSGIDGSFIFTVTLTRGGTLLTTVGIQGIITARPFVAVKKIGLFLLYDLNVRIVNIGNASTGNLTLALSGADADAFMLPETTLNSLPAGSNRELTITPRTDLTEGTYTAMLTVSGENIAPVTMEIRHTVTFSGIENVPQTKALKVWLQNGQLHVSGLTINQPWSVYNVSGVLVHQRIAESDEANVPLPVRGIYIVTSGSNRVKVSY